MLDLKILAAVLVSLAAFGMVSGSSSMTLDKPSEMLSQDFDNIGPRSLGAFIGVIDDDETREEVYAELNFNSSGNQEMSVKAGSLNVEDLDAVKLEEGTVSSDSSIMFLNFTGTVGLAKESTVSGSANTIVTSGVNLTGDYNFGERISTPRITAQDATVEKMKVKNVNGVIESGSTSSRLQDDTEVNIRGFNGEVEIQPINGTIVFDGSVTRLEAGSVNIG